MKFIICFRSSSATFGTLYNHRNIVCNKRNKHTDEQLQYLRLSHPFDAEQDDDVDFCVRKQCTKQSTTQVNHTIAM